MSHLRPFARPLAILVLLAATSVPAFVALPVAAQSGVEPFVFSNDITEDEDSDEEWQVQVTVQPLDGCVPEHGEPGYAPSWLAAGARTGVLLSVGECVFNITATVRETSTDDCLFTAQLSWVRSDGTTTGQFYNSVITSARPRGVSSLSITLAPGRVCNVLNQTHFVIHGTEIVEELPGRSADPDLLALAQQAATTRDFRVRIAPDYRSGDVPSSCNRDTHILVRGDGARVAQALQPTGVSCRFRATVVDAPAPFEIVEGSGESFDAAAANLLVDLSSLVRLRPARIAIIQDVMGSTRRGTVTYTIARSCGGVTVPSAEPVTGRINLLQGRGTVHSPQLPCRWADHCLPGGRHEHHVHHDRGLLGERDHQRRAGGLRPGWRAHPHADVDGRQPIPPLRLRVRHHLRCGNPTHHVGRPAISDDIHNATSRTGRWAARRRTHRLTLSSLRARFPVRTTCPPACDWRRVC